MKGNINMATYIQIQEWVKQKYGFIPKTCWIADVKQKKGIHVHKAPNRIGMDRVYPCPTEKEKPIVEALKHFGMIK